MEQPFKRLDAAQRRFATRQWVMDFCLTEPTPETLDSSFDGEPMYQMVPVPETFALSSTLAFTVTLPTPLTTTFARLVFRSVASRLPVPLTEIDRLSERPAMRPLPAPDMETDRDSLSRLVALTDPTPLVVSFRNSLTVTLKCGPLPLQKFPSADDRYSVPFLTSEVNSDNRLSSAVSSRLSWPVCSISRLPTVDRLMAVNFSTGRASVLRLPEPVVTGPLDTLQAVRTSRVDKTAAGRNMARVSQMVAALDHNQSYMPFRSEEHTSELQSL